jgi:hypothetical protein
MLRIPFRPYSKQCVSLSLLATAPHHSLLARAQTSCQEYFEDSSNVHGLVVDADIAVSDDAQTSDRTDLFSVCKTMLLGPAPTLLHWSDVEALVWGMGPTPPAATDVVVLTPEEEDIISKSAATASGPAPSSLPASGDAVSFVAPICSLPGAANSMRLTRSSFADLVMHGTAIHDNIIDTFLAHMAESTAVKVLSVAESVVFFERPGPSGTRIDTDGSPENTLATAAEVLLPWHYAGNHWVLLYIQNNGDAHNVHIYDAIQSPAKDMKTASVQHAFTEFFKTRLARSDVVTVAWHPEVPKQTNGTECGINIIVMALHILARAPMPTAAAVPVKEQKRWRILLAIAFLRACFMIK